MKHYLLTLALFLTLPLVHGQEAKQETHPRTALEQTRRDFREAQAKGNSPAIVKSLVTEFKCLAEIDLDSIPDFINRVEKFTQNNPRPAERCILHSMLAEFYTNYCLAQTNLLHDRTPVTGYVPKDMNEWTSNIYRDKVLLHLEQSLAAPEELEKTSPTDYEPTIRLGKDSPALRPTLYDFLAYRAIDLLKSSEYSGLYPHQTNNQFKFLCSLEECLSMDIKGNDFYSHLLKFYQQLLRSQLKRKATDASLFTELSRLDCVSNLSIFSETHKNKFTNLLEQLYASHQNSPYSVEVIHALAKQYRISGNTRDQQLANNQKALRLCEDGIRRFPDYARIDILKQLRDEIITPRHIVSSTLSYPGKDVEIMLSYSNLKAVTLTLYKVDATVENYQFQKRKQVPRQRILSHTFRLPEYMTLADTILQFPIRETGIYEIVMNYESNQPTSADTVATYCTRLAGITHTGGDRQEILICDRMSGQPVPNARVRLFQASSYRTYRFIREVEADSNGIAVFDIDKRLCYQVVCGDDTHAPIKDNLIPPSDIQPRQHNAITLFTDRSVYRPGQTVYFKGICWKGNYNNCRATAGKRIEIILRDANRQEVSKQTLTTNEFGSFAGQFSLPSTTLSGNFIIEAEEYSHIIEVMEYKRPKFEIQFDPVRTAYETGDKIYISGKVNSFSGIPLDQCEVSYSVSCFENIFEEKRPLFAGKLHTDKAGVFEIPISTDTTHFSYVTFTPDFGVYVINVEVTAPNGETQSESHSIRVSQKAFDILALTQRCYNQDSTANIPIQTLNQDHFPIRTTLSYKLQTIARSPFPRDEYLPYESTPGKTWAEGTFTTPSDIASHPDSTLRIDTRQMPSGAYLLTLSGTGKNSDISRQEIIYLYSRHDTRPPINTYSWTAPVKTTCAIGEEAEFIFGTSVENAHVLYEIYSDGRLLRRERLLLSDENRTFRIPYEQEFGAECEVLFTYLKNDHLSSTRFKLQQTTMKKELDIATATFRDRLTPGQTEEWTFTVKNSKGEGVIAEWLAGMYDSSLDEFGDNTWAFNPNQRFFPASCRWDYFVTSWLPEFHSTSSMTPKQKKYIIPGFVFDSWDLSLPRNLTNPRFYVRGVSSLAGTINGLPATLSADAATAPINTQEKSIASKQFDQMKEELVEIDNMPQKTVRQNFNETAFFYPQLRTNERGEVVVRFTVPESTTTWRFQALAHTPDMCHGLIEREIVTAKEFMVSTNLPRFVRVGDQVVIRTTLNNLRKACQGEAVLEVFDPATEEILFRQTRPFSIDEAANETLDFSFDVPKRQQPLGCRIVASAGNFSDGEQHLLPVLPEETLITQTVPVFLTQQGTADFKVKVPRGATPYRLTLELTANPTWYAVLALPALHEAKTESVTDITAAYYTNILSAAIAKANPGIAQAIREWSGKQTPATTSPLAQNEELKNILLQLTPWVAEAQDQTERLRSLATLFDENRQLYLATLNLGKLRELQNEDGGWPWFKNFRSNAFITLNTLQALARLVELGALEADQEIRTMQVNALRFVDNTIVDLHKNDTSASSSDILYLYVRSSYRDIPLGNALTVHKALLTDAKRSWPNYGIYEKALAAIALHRYGDSQTAQEILSSLKEFATVNPEQGMFWANNRATIFTNSPVLVHTTLMAAFHEIEGNSPDIERMKQWLLCQKQTQDWGDVPSTVDAVHALLLTGSNQLASGERLSISINKKPLETEPLDERLGYIKHSVSTAELPRKATTISISKRTASPSWGGIYLQYFQKQNEATANATEVSIEKRLFLKRTTDEGERLVPVDSLAPGTLNVGDRLTVRLTVCSDRDMEFVHLCDLRAANLEPTAQLPGTRRQGSLLYYQDIKDVCINFFFDFLPRGTHILEYDTWITQAGEYTNGVATLQCVYAPQFTANSKGSSISVAQ